MSSRPAPPSPSGQGELRKRIETELPYGAMLAGVRRSFDQHVRDPNQIQEANVRGTFAAILVHLLEVVEGRDWLLAVLRERGGQEDGPDLRLCDGCEAESGKGVADSGDTACSVCGAEDAPHGYVVERGGQPPVEPLIRVRQIAGILAYEANWTGFAGIDRPEAERDPLLYGHFQPWELGQQLLEIIDGVEEAADHVLWMAEHLRPYWDGGSVGAQKMEERLAKLRSLAASGEGND